MATPVHMRPRPMGVTILDREYASLEDVPRFGTTEKGKPMRFVATAFCTRPWCHIGEFTTRRASMSFVDGDGEKQEIRHLRCPYCGGLARVTSAREVA